MQGARRAIASGASDEAARALSTALKHLKGRDRDEGIILLAETLQEMADWKGSLEVLEEIEGKRTIEPELRELRDVLILGARRGTSFYSPTEQEQLVLTILDRMPSLRSSETACRYALLAARMASGLRSAVAYGALRELLERMPNGNLSPRLQAMRDLALAMSVCHTGDRPLSLSIVRKCLQELPDLADSTVVSLYLGVGAMCGWLGEYSLALQADHPALVGAQRLSNDLLASIACANLALDNFRLGEYKKAREHAEMACRLSLAQPCASFSLIRGTYFQGMAAAFANELAETDTALTRLTKAIPSAEMPWQRQFGYLYLADLHTILGQRRAALQAAAKGIEMSDLPLTHSVSGIYGRWLAILTARIRDKGPGRERLLTIASGHETLDLLDRAEIDCAVLYLEMGIGRLDENRAARLRQCLAALPLPVSHQLDRLGILACSGMPKSFPKTSLRA
jgi:tetratricopeptide (TPR) repeat protein